MQNSRKSAAAHTAADLDAMDDKLCRLGLDVEHMGGTPAVSQGQSSEDYLHRIRTAKMEKQQARFDRAARQAVAAEKHQTVTSATPSVGKNTGTMSAEETAIADKALLASDTDEAAAWVRQDHQKSATQKLRAERMIQSAQRQQQPYLSTRQTSTLPTAASVHNREATTWSSTAEARAEARRRAIAPWCAGVAHGVVELAIEVSDHRHLSSTGLAGRPVFRLQQDLSVTQWRDWVEEFVFSRAASAAAAAEIKARAAEAAEAAREALGSPDNSAANAAISASAQAAAALSVVQKEAARCVEAAAAAEAEDAAQAQQKAVAAVLARLQAEVQRQCKAAEEAVRREADEPRLSAAAKLLDVHGGNNNSGTTLVKVQREEVLPGWAQRMPPAGCLVFGDDLSGARLLVGTVEVCMQRGLSAMTQQHSTPAVGKSTHHGANTAAHVAAAVAASDPAEDSHRDQIADSLGAAMPNASFGKTVAVAASEDPLAGFTMTDIGLESGDGVEGGFVVTYVTPKTLMGTTTMGGGGADSRRAGSASRGGKLQGHGLLSAAATANSQSSATTSNNAGGGGGGGNSTINGGGGGGSAIRGGRRASATANDGRRSAEQQLAEAAVKELVRVHRHNLGALAGDKVPAWAPSAASAAASATTTTTTTEEDEKAAPKENVRPPLQTLFLIGFPDSATFAEYFADRLRSATAAVETELLEVEARRRAAEQQALAVAIAAETVKQRSPSTKNAKSTAGAPSRQKSNRSPKAAVEAEEGTVSALVDQLRLTFALPPLSVLSVFLTYDLPTRQCRLEDATFSPEPQQQPQHQGLSLQPHQLLRGMSDSTEEDDIAAAAAGNITCEFLHPIYHPCKMEEREVEPSFAGSFRRTVGGGGQPSSISTPPLSSAASVLPSHLTARAVDTWSVSCLRSELKQQDTRQHLQRQAWVSAVTAAFVKRSREAATDLRRVPASFYAAGKRRDKTSGSAALDADRSSQGSRLTSLTIPPAKAADGVALPIAPPAGAVTTAGSPPPLAEMSPRFSLSHLLPRVLFFARVLDVSDVTASTAVAGDATADANALGHAVWRSSSVNGGSVTTSGMSETACDAFTLTARAAKVDEIIMQLHLLCRPAGGRALTSDLLLPNQLPEPFRLGDYRLPDAVCMRLRQVHEAYASLLPDPSSVLRADRALLREGSDAVVKAATAALQAETAAWGAVQQYAEDLFSLIAYDVFCDEAAAAAAGGEGNINNSVMSNNGTNVRHHPDRCGALTMPVTAGLLNSTAHFTNIDRSYARAKDAITQHTSYAEAHIRDCLALLLRLSLDFCVTQLAASVRLLCAALDRSAQNKLNLYGLPFSAPLEVDESVGEQLLLSLPRLPEETARQLVAQLHVNPSTSSTTAAQKDASEAFCTMLSQVYWDDVKRSTMNILAQHLEHRGREQSVVDGAVVDATGGEDVLETSNTILKPPALSVPLANLMATVELLVEHIKMAPTPFHRLIIVLREMQYKAQLLHDGADAWVELLYHDVLATQSDNSTAPQPQQQQLQKLRRPQSIDQLADGPQAVLNVDALTFAVPPLTAPGGSEVHSDPASGVIQPSRWQCGDLEVFLATMPQPDLSGFVTATAFQRGLLKNQLSRVWRFLPDSTTAVAAQVNYTVSPTAATAGEEQVQQRGSLRAANANATLPLAATGIRRALLPDTALDAYLIYDCPCKTAPSSPHVPFLTVNNVHVLCALAMGDVGKAGAASTTFGSPGMSLKGSQLYLQQWLIDVALNRCCFCSNNSICGGGGIAAASSTSLTDRVGLSTFRHPAIRRVIPIPSSRALRQVVLSLPASVLEQVNTLGQKPVPAMVSILNALPTVPRMYPGWMQTQWWWMQDRYTCEAGEGSGNTSITSSDCAQRNVALCWALWRILLSSSGTSTAVSSAVSSTLFPSLAVLLRLLLIGSTATAAAAAVAGGVIPWEERVRRAFHCLAALRCVRGVSSSNPEVTPIADETNNGGDCDVDAAMAIEDDMALTREEYVLLGELLMAPVPMQSGSTATETTWWGGPSSATTTAASTGKGVAELLTDVQLLLQMENTEQVTLPLLLSSRWAQLMLATHF